MFDLNPQNSTDCAALAILIDELPDGARIQWQSIEDSTGVPMTDRGKELFRRMVRRANRRYLAINAWGVELSSPTNAIEITAKAVGEITSAAQRAGKTAKTLVTRHGPELSDDDKRKLIATVSVAGALKCTSADQSKALVVKRASEKLLPEKA